MLAPPIFPEWLPPAVAQEAERLLNSGYADDELVVRLATDKRMESVWRELRKRERISAHLQISEVWAELRSRDAQSAEEESALTLFFWCAYALAVIRPRVSTVPKNRVAISFYRWQAAQLRVSETALHGTSKIPADMQELLGEEFPKWKFEDHANHVAEAARFCNAVADRLTKLEAAMAPLVIRRNHGQREARGYVRMLATETRQLFGTPFYGSLAKVASVALSKDITSIQARKWCANKDA